MSVRALISATPQQGGAEEPNARTRRACVRRRWYIAFGVVAVLALGGGSLAWIKQTGGPYALRLRRAFDREGWLAAAEDRDGTRYLMVDDLLIRHPLVGSDIATVRELLGAPRWSALQGGRTSLGYYLGPEPGFVSIDSVWLILTVEREQVIGANLGTD